MSLIDAIVVTPIAFQKISEALHERPALGLRIGVKGGGCDGLQYVIEYCDVERPEDLKITDGTTTVFVDRKSARILAGTTLDFKETFQKKGFEFLNPRQKTSCGCGESFSI